MNKNSTPLINRRIVIWLGVITLLFSTVVVIFAGVRSNASNYLDLSLVNLVAPPLNSSDWTLGNKNAKVTLIEYGDYQCPACGSYFPIVKRITNEYGDRVLFVFREFPLSLVHDDAEMAAKAAEAAGLQNKYWEMHDLLYEKQLEWSLLPFGIGLRQYLDSFASSLGLDINKFNNDMDSEVVRNKIDSDVAGAKVIHVEHTPTFFLNLKRIPNPQGYDDFKSSIDKALSLSN